MKTLERCLWVKKILNSKNECVIVWVHFKRTHYHISFACLLQKLNLLYLALWLCYVCLTSYVLESSQFRCFYSTTWAVKHIEFLFNTDMNSSTSAPTTSVVVTDSTKDATGVAFLSCFSLYSSWMWSWYATSSLRISVVSCDLNAVSPPAVSTSHVDFV